MRFRPTLRPCPLVLLAALVLILLAGCSKTQAGNQLTSAWPVANAERRVPKPEGPPRWPLTGLTAPNAAAMSQRVVSVKIENSAASRPQTGLQSADVVYESLAEGGITRFNALFHSAIPKDIGPVRSARLSDLWIVPQYDALFFFSGASTFVSGRVKKAGIPNLSEDAGVTYPFYRSRQRNAPHNLMLIGDRAREEGIRKGYPATQTLRPFSFDYRKTESTPTVSQIDIPFAPGNRVKWTYDPKARAYKRDNNGRAHTDTQTGKQLTAQNVVVMWAAMKYSGHRDVAGNETYDIELSGQNRASIFREGQRYDGTWTADAENPPVFKSSDGTVIRLSPGNSWFEVIPTNVNISLR